MKARLKNFIASAPKTAETTKHKLKDFDADSIARELIKKQNISKATETTEESNQLQKKRYVDNIT